MNDHLDSLVVDTLSDDVEHVFLVLLHLLVPHLAGERHAVAGHATGNEFFFAELDRNFHRRMGYNMAHATHAEAHEWHWVGLQDAHLELLGLERQRDPAEWIFNWALVHARARLQMQVILLERR